MIHLVLASGSLESTFKYSCELGSEINISQFLLSLNFKKRKRGKRPLVEKAKDVDLFITPSEYYSQKSQEKMKLDPEKIEVVYSGINFS